MPSRTNVEAIRAQTKSSEGMPPLRSEAEIVAICCADLHLSHRPPVARSAETSWYDTMKRVLHQLHALSEEHQCPIIFAGDLFDKSNPPPELINFAMENLPPDMYCVAGQHDIPLHNLSDIHKSGYWSLVLAGTINHLDYHKPIYLRRQNLILHGHSWGQDVTPFPDSNMGYTHVAVVHDYIWMNKHNSYPGAPEKAQLQKWFKRLDGYNAAVFGDNHIPFEGEGYSVRTIYNCGSLMRRNADQVEHKPSVGLLCADGSITRHYLDCSEDKFIDQETLAKCKVIDADLFVEHLGKLGAIALDFEQSVKEWCQEHNVDDSVKRLILEAMENT